MIATIAELREIASRVTDPEIPVLTIEDLGILRDVDMEGDTVVVTITPTYSGCPAMDAITEDLGIVFKESGYDNVRVNLVLSPAWSTDWMTESGKTKLQAYGIAPPTGTGHRGPVTLGISVKCPQCHSLNTKELSRFGSTACKSMYQCKDCLEPFDYFKVLS